MVDVAEAMAAEALHNMFVHKRAGYSFEEWATEWPGEDVYISRSVWNSIDVSEPQFVTRKLTLDDVKNG